MTHIWTVGTVVLLALSATGCGSLLAVQRCHTEPLTWTYADGSTFRNTVTICDAVTR